MTAAETVPQDPSQQQSALHEPRGYPLTPEEIRLLTGGSLGRLIEFAASARLHAIDHKGDTPLHLAARRGSLAACDAFIQAGADPCALNHEGQTPADVALAEGHRFEAELLLALVGERAGNYAPEHHPDGKTRAASAEWLDESLNDEPNGSRILYDENSLLTFEAEIEPHEFFGRSEVRTASGRFLPTSSHSPTTSTEERDWIFDLSPAQIAGEGIESNQTVVSGNGGEHDYLKARNRGRKSEKRVVVQSGTRLSIDLEICTAWAANVFDKGWCTLGEIDALAASCDGDGDPKDLRANLQRTLEAAGLEIAHGGAEEDVEVWEARSDVSRDELAEAIQSALSRDTLLPGTRRFVVDKSREAQLLQPIIRVNRELQLNVLACDAAVEIVLASIDQVCQHSRNPGSVTLRSIAVNNPDHAETAEFFTAGEALRLWYDNGRAMDGKRRREALEALEALDLTFAFYKEIVSHLKSSRTSLDHAVRLAELISIYEAATEHLILEHLSYARRFAARNVLDGEDPEDVFQVAVTGLLHSTRRFDPERGIRFVLYCAFWMKQALTRWRGDEGSAIRVPVHRQENLAKLDRAIEMLDTRAFQGVSDDELAGELGWTNQEVRLFRSIPRQSDHPESVEAWDALMPAPAIEDALSHAESERIITEELAELAEVDERQADVIRMRFGIGYEDAMTLEQIGQLYGVTRERIRQIEAKGLAYLAQPARKRRLRALLGG